MYYLYDSCPCFSKNLYILSICYQIFSFTSFLEIFFWQNLYQCQCRCCHFSLSGCNCDCLFSCPQDCLCGFLCGYFTVGFGIVFAVVLRLSLLLPFHLSLQVSLHLFMQFPIQFTASSLVAFLAVSMYVILAASLTAITKQGFFLPKKTNDYTNIKIYLDLKRYSCKVQVIFENQINSIISKYILAR